MTRRLRIVWSPRYEVDIGPHVFPTAKYRLVRERLLRDGTVPAAAFVEPEPAGDEDLLRVHTAGWLEKIARNALTAEERLRLEVPFSRALAEAMRLCCGGTVLAARLALEEGIACHLGGGFHHAFAAHGEGFCLLNDVAVAAAAVLAEGRAARVAVIDLDVHHGNGTAAIFTAEPRVFTLSMHQQANYPALKPSSDLDVGLADATGDAEYLRRLEEALPRVLDGHEPQMVLYLAGADPYRQDQLEGLRLTRDGLRWRDRAVLAGCRARGIAVATVPAGGYAADPDDTVAIHAATVEEAVAAADLGG